LLTNILTNLVVAIALQMPSAETPAMIRWAEGLNGYGQGVWALQGSQTRAFCQDVTIEFGSRSNRCYWVEWSFDLREWDPRRIGTESAPYWVGTGERMAVRFGWPWAVGFWRVREL